jgi:hypothetical protein
VLQTELLETGKTSSSRYSYPPSFSVLLQLLKETGRIQNAWLCNKYITRSGAGEPMARQTGRSAIWNSTPENFEATE